MLLEKTTFIVGAALSAEQGLPLGSELKAHIRANLPSKAADGGGDKHIGQLLATRDSPRWMQAALRLRAAIPYAASIDNLVEHHTADQEFVTVAKWSIAQAIHKAEIRSDIGSQPRTHPDRPNDMSGQLHFMPENSYSALFRLIVQNVPKHELKEAFRRFSVVTFNYDRTLEAYMVRALQRYSGLSPTEAEDVFSTASIVHAYGVLDPRRRLRRDGRAFGEVTHCDDIHHLAEGVFTYSESLDSGLMKAIKTMVAASERLVFLGCAYHRQNMMLLRPNSMRASAVFGTVYVPPPPDAYASPSLEAFSHPTRASLINEVADWSREAGPQCYIQPMTCRQLIAHYGVNWCE